MPVDNHVKRMLEELKVALAQAVRSSPGVTDTIRKIREQGFNLHLVLSFDQGDEADEDPAHDGTATDLRAVRGAPASRRRAYGSEGSAERPEQRHQIELTPRGAPAWVPTSRERGSTAAGAARRQPAFRLNGYDVTLLKSLGIDPTRKGRQTRRRPPGRGRL